MFEIFRKFFRNFLKWFSNIAHIIFKIILWNNSPNSPHYFSRFLKYFSRISAVFLETSWNIFRSFPKFFQDIRKQFSKISRILPEIFIKNISWNFPKCFSKMYEVFLEIFEILKKWFSKISDIIHEISWNYSPNSPQLSSKCFQKCSKISVIFLDIFLKVYTNFF